FENGRLKACPRLPASADELVLFLFGDDFFLNAGGDLLVARELHGESALAFGHAADVGGVAEGFGEGDFGGNRGDTVTHVGVDDHAAAADEVTGDRALEILGALDLDLHDWLKQDGLGVFEVFAEAVFRGRLKRSVAGIDFVV